MNVIYDDKYVNRYSIRPKVYVEPFPILPENEYIRLQKTTFGKCKPILIDKKKKKTKNNLFEFYDPKAKGEPFVSRLYTGFNFKEMGKPQEAWKSTNSNESVDNTFWSYDHNDTNPYSFNKF